MLCHHPSLALDDLSSNVSFAVALIASTFKSIIIKQSIMSERQQQQMVHVSPQTPSPPRAPPPAPLIPACTADTDRPCSAPQVQCTDLQAAQRHVPTSHCPGSITITRLTPTPTCTPTCTPTQWFGVGGQPGSCCRSCQLLHSWAADPDTKRATGKDPLLPTPPPPPRLGSSALLSISLAYVSCCRWR